AHKRLPRWSRRDLEACKQSCRACAPEVTAPLTFESLLALSAAEEERSSERLRLMFVERGGKPLSETTRDFVGQPAVIMALVGPEGGWGDKEIETARAANWNLVTLGGRTLRAETAAMQLFAVRTD